MPDLTAHQCTPQCRAARTTQERDQYAAILGATMAALHLDPDGDLNAIPAAAAEMHDAARNLRQQLDRANTARRDDAELVALVAQAMRDANTYEAWAGGLGAVPFGHFAEAAVRALADAWALGPGGWCPACGQPYPRTLPAGQDPRCASCSLDNEQTVSSVIAVSSRFSRAAGEEVGVDGVRLRTGSGRQYEGYRSLECPGDGVPGHQHDIRCIRTDRDERRRIDDE